MKKAYFISDLHLGTPYSGDVHAAERRIVDFLESIRNDAEEIYLLGDILDYWYEYRYCVPRGFVRFFGELARLSDSGIKITWLIGNHDIWIFDYLPQELGVEVVDGILIREILGKNFLMAHGDGLGNTSFSFRLIRSLFRNKLCQKLYASVHPRWTIPMAHKWSRASRKNDNHKPANNQKHINSLRDFCVKESVKRDNIDYYVFGHLHEVVEDRVNDSGAEMIVLGDWLSHFSYGVFDGNNFKIKYLEGV